MILIWVLLGSCLFLLLYIIGVIEYTVNNTFGGFLKKSDRVKYNRVNFRSDYFFNVLSSFTSPMLMPRLPGYNFITIHFGVLSRYHISNTGVVLRGTKLHRVLKREFKRAIEERKEQIYVDEINDRLRDALIYRLRETLSKPKHFKFGR